MTNKVKILVCGDVKGKFKTVFSRVAAINEKNGPFEFLFCVGDFFGDSADSWEPYKRGILTVPVPTYILGPNQEDHVIFYKDISGCDLCPNVSYLGKRGILTSSGLSIAYLSGVEGTKSSPTTFSKSDVSDLKDIAVRSKITGTAVLGVDILISSVWPKDVTNLDTKCEVEGLSNRTSEHLAWLATQLRPRYHFAGIENKFYERPPYENIPQGNETNIHCTRFIALASVGSTGKNKWIYAASITPIDEIRGSELYQATTDQTPFPFKRELSGSGSHQYFYDMTATDEPNTKKRKHDNEFQKRKQNIDQGACWFCLASPSVEKHLVISIGELVYLALAKGGLTEYHVMILPIQHHRSFAEISDEIRDEVKKFKSALKKFFKSMKMVPVFFERNFKSSHMQFHCIPVRKGLVERLLPSFQSNAEDRGFELSVLPDHCKLKDTAKVDSPYFYVELPSSQKLFCSCKRDFPLQFGRDVLAADDILDLPHKVDWRDCILSKEDEIKAVEKFREEFKTFDFTNEDDDSS